MAQQMPAMMIQCLAEADRRGSAEEVDLEVQTILVVDTRLD